MFRGAYPREFFQNAVALIVRSVVLSAQSAGQQRLLFLRRAVEWARRWAKSAVA